MKSNSITTGWYVQGRNSDYVFHPPSGSSLPGKVDANPYLNYPPDDLRKLLLTEENPAELEKMNSALKQWERQFQDIGYPFKRVASRLRALAEMLLRKAEQVGPAQNLNYYQDIEVPEGFESILEGIEYWNKDNYDLARFDYNRQGERPLVDMDFLEGDFLTPKNKVFDEGVVTPRGDGSDPENMDYPFPPTGGPIDQWPDSI